MKQDRRGGGNKLLPGSGGDYILTNTINARVTVCLSFTTKLLKLFK